MRRLVGKVCDGEVLFSTEVLKHIKVLRLKIGEKIEILDPTGIYECIVETSKPFRTKIINKKSIDYSRELKSDITLFLPLLKNGNFELCLQKSVELGVKSIVPIITARTIVKSSAADFINKKQRYQRILTEASEQSNRDIIPKLGDLHYLKDLKDYEFSFKFVPYEEESLKNSFIRNSALTNSSIGIVVGPEGGFAVEEVDFLKEIGYQPISLGRRILRAETAVINILSIVSYLLEVTDAL